MHDDDPSIAAARKEASEYAWKWFQYHAAQRQTVFQFFLAIIGAVLAGYFALTHDGNISPLSRLFGVLVLILSFLFWRLDCRGRRLVKIGERYLAQEEQRLAALLSSNEICFIANADADKGEYPSLICVHSFRQIYRYIFILIGALGVLVILR
jgi:hypothetical protein